MGAMIKVLIRACRFYILLSSCTIAVLMQQFLWVLNFGRFQGGDWPILGGGA